ncbi:MAG: hypothetical protein O7E52_05440 [Candidatus Poribacteria bacterium]|nr:hypothetical protein [Candidatus Poribacteria bacterium]
MSRKQLTAKQHSFYEFVVDYLRENSVWPTYREIIDQFGYRSPKPADRSYAAAHRPRAPDHADVRDPSVVGLSSSFSRIP